VSERERETLSSIKDDAEQEEEEVDIMLMQKQRIEWVMMSFSAYDASLLSRREKECKQNWIEKQNREWEREREIRRERERKWGGDE
jgi:hypothetical protein